MTATPALTPIALCADDYGQNQAIDAAVDSLLDGGRLSAVSCFSTAPRWLGLSAPLLRERSGIADVGLHLNLTEDFGVAPGAASSLPMQIARSYLRLLNRVQLRTILHRQCDAFEAGLGRVPDFIDGHQHVHQLPVVRELLLELVQTRYAGQRMWIRNTLPATPRWRGKAQILKRLGGAHLARRLEQSGLATNRGFGGVYGFDTDDYASRFEQWLTAAQPGMLLMCHPAIALQDNDAIAAQRVVEYHFFNSAQFPAMLEGHAIRLQRLSAIIDAGID
ncbi:ChbG/HpnK family deacetylase [Undibacterium arcticum]|uniref:ChbG/HpnK family deacetylase n=1 Tax=Undibacterium arcticum TaxID=1762892 RepID=A0ABV7EVM8_9BURK